MRDACKTSRLTRASEARWAGGAVRTGMQRWNPTSSAHTHTHEPDTNWPCHHSTQETHARSNQKVFCQILAFLLIVVNSVHSQGGQTSGYNLWSFAEMRKEHFWGYFWTPTGSLLASNSFWDTERLFFSVFIFQDFGKWSHLDLYAWMCNGWGMDPEAVRHSSSLKTAS